MPIPDVHVPVHAPLLRWIARAGLVALVLVGSAWLMAGPMLLLLQSAAASTSDQRVAAWVHAHSTGLTIQALGVVSHVHGTAGILSLSAAAGAVLGIRDRRDLWPCLVLTAPGGLLLNLAVKLAIQRARPTWDYAAQTLTSFSFPSGHTLGATVFYGFVVVALWPAARGLVRAALLVAAVLMVVLVAASRIALGVHYFSDCVAAVVEGCIWLAACTLGLQSITSHRSGSRPLPA